MYFHCLTVKIVVIIIGEVALASRSWSTAAGSVREAEVVAEATCLLQSLTEHLVLLDIIVRHRPREKNSSTKISNKILFRPSGKLHCLLEVSLGDLWNWIIVIINIHSNTLLLSLLLSPDVSINALSDGQLASSLTYLSEVSARESLGHLGQVGQVHLLGDGALPQVGLEDGHS